MFAQIGVIEDLLDGDPSHLGDIESWCDTVLDNPALKAELDTRGDIMLIAVCLYRGLANQSRRDSESEKESFVWLVRASYCENALAGYAQHALGECYLFGRGVSFDPSRARHWFTKAQDSLLRLLSDSWDSSAVIMLYHIARHELFRYPDAVKWYTIGARKRMRDALLLFNRSTIPEVSRVWDPEEAYPIDEVERCIGVGRKRIVDTLHEVGYGDALDVSDVPASLDGIAASLVQDRVLSPKPQSDLLTDRYRSLLAECEARLGFRFTTDEKEVRRTCQELHRRLNFFAEYDRWMNERSDRQPD
ncbi:SEL1-like repeat protein [Bifidobacterium sp. UTCIF-39]|uniref:SEL1-like repeat protein n=1 Tax=Bifidobacterium sp. UTCIF-39 TaxID=1465359 RepID=UPI0015E3F29E|nr:SEL1-like repeat protein [Bifidobacterium sp. UTCIF-39]